MKTKKDRLWLVELWHGDMLTTRAVITTLKGVQAWTKLQLDSTTLNLEYKSICREAAIRPVVLWCAKRWTSEEEALYNPEAQHVQATLIPLIKIK